MKQEPAASGCAHAPETHTSLVQAIASGAQALPSLAAVTAHPPAPSHADADWHSVGAQVYALPAHAPPVHTSFFVQPFPSSQEPPFGVAVHADWLDAGWQL